MSSHPGAGSRRTFPVTACTVYLHSSVLGMLLKSGDSAVAMSKSQPAYALHSRETIRGIIFPCRVIKQTRRQST